jgi:hypothetical protein
MVAHTLIQRKPTLNSQGCPSTYPQVPLSTVCTGTDGGAVRGLLVDQSREGLRLGTPTGVLNLRNAPPVGARSRHRPWPSHLGESRTTLT